jgi:hypothetical protein
MAMRQASSTLLWAAAGRLAAQANAGGSLLAATNGARYAARRAGGARAEQRPGGTPGFNFIAPPRSQRLPLVRLGAAEVHGLSGVARRGALLGDAHRWSAVVDGGQQRLGSGGTHGASACHSGQPGPHGANQGHTGPTGATRGQPGPHGANRGLCSDLV